MITSLQKKVFEIGKVIENGMITYHQQKGKETTTFIHLRIIYFNFILNIIYFNTYKIEPQTASIALYFGEIALYFGEI